MVKLSFNEGVTTTLRNRGVRTAMGAVRGDSIP